MKNRLVLASNSPRRKELLRGLGIDFEVRLIRDIDESFPATLPVSDVAVHISKARRPHTWTQWPRTRWF